MDSLTQILLGAACGEVVAGKKLGNRALLWGAVGGTIPDMDVFATFFTDEISATAFHRGFMHSFLFAALMPWVLARLAQWFYGDGVYRRRGYKIGAMSLWLLFYVGAATGINFIPVLLGEGLKWSVLVPTLALGSWFALKLWRDYWNKDLKLVEAPYFTWVSLFFWSIFTHPILDCFTSWGTQVFQPFSDLRVQWNTVSVVDPIATVPFGLALIVVSCLLRGSRARAAWNWVGLLWFCGYLGYTCWHKQAVNHIFEQSLRQQNIRYERFMTGPTIFNNIVWSAVAENDTAYYMGLYGFNDPRASFEKIICVPKNHESLRDVAPDDRAMQFIRWFSNGYYNVVRRPDGRLQINDLRFGLLGDRIQSAQSYVFPFVVDEIRGGGMKIHHERNVDEGKKAFGVLWDRVRGIKGDAQ